LHPLRAGFPVCDTVGGLNAAFAILAALYHRERTGEGQLVKVNMLDAITTLQMQELSVFVAGKVPQQRSAEPHAHVYIRAPYGTFKTADGFLALAMPDLPTLGKVIDEPAFAEMSSEVHGWSHRDEVHRRTADRLVLRTTAEWLDALGAAGIWCGPVQDYAALVEDPQIKHNGTFVEYDHPTEGRVTTPGFPYAFSRTPASIERGAPLVGEHTGELLAEAGFTGEEIAALTAGGVVAETRPEQPV
ncbi:MAG: CaiB/BaiF CoA transferase family protein, partial [Nocardioidaceae bacterium]